MRRRGNKGEKGSEEKKKSSPFLRQSHDIQGVQGGICMFCISRLDWHENSDLRSKSATGTT